MPPTDEIPVVFDCGGCALLGILHAKAAVGGVVFVFVVGGPQYRVGSHRMFVQMARLLASAGYSAMRFDCRGMGDSDGTFNGFETVADDVRSAIDCALARTSAEHVVLIGLCDGASASALYCSSDPRVIGLVLLNPWVRTESGEARARVRHYYGMRVWQGEFWHRLLRGKLDVWGSVTSLLRNLRVAIRTPSDSGFFVDGMLASLSSFQGRVLCLLSTQDLVAQEFSLLVNSAAPWGRLMRRPNFEFRRVEGADHTLSGNGQIRSAVDAVIEWCRR